MRTLSLLEQSPATRGTPSLSPPQQRSAGTYGRACSASPDTVDVRGTAVTPAEGRAPAADPSLGGSRFAAPHARMVERGAWSCWGPQWGSRSSSSSVCTEDVAARCWEGTVGTSEEEEEEDGSGQDGAPLPWQCPWQDMSPGLMRRGSLESLGARISRLSQSGAVTPCPAPSGHPAQGRGDASHWGSSSRAKPSVTTVHGEDGDAGHLRRPSGSSASRSRARAMGHCRWQEPPARRGWHGGDVTLTAEKEGDGDGRRRALCTKAAVGPTRRCSPRAEGRHEVSCPGHAAKPRWQRWKQKAVLSHRLAALRQALRSSQEGMQEPGAGAQGMQSDGDGARARAWDCVDVEEVQVQKGCAERPGKVRRKTLDLREEKRELQERLCGLELRMRSMLRQRQEALGQLRAVLQKERMATLRRLQESLEKVNGTICVCQNCHPEELAAPGALKEPLTPERALREAATCVWDPARPPSPSPSTPGLSHATGAQRRGEHLCHRSASSLPPSTVPRLQQQHHTALGVLHHVQRCLRELQVEDLGVLGAELGTTANEERFLMPPLDIPPSPNRNKLAAATRTRDEAWRW
ncbi:uncharacterized protein LOC101750822 isoform X1 [Gallus gallus]|uniref:uncharacterized protein LOC101750822 isoform X1 n=1 Tax=Gallus gallus TaxID=9031 RepID=UPI001F01C497|nr:uncharacterized protein LOC101750822 isoform X1 [Gallus gallus]